VKKRVVIAGVLMMIGLVAFSSYKSLLHNIEHSNKQAKQFADLRLSLADIKKKVENKIDFILENLTQNGATVTSKEMQSLIEEIRMIRAYGKDIDTKAKVKLLKIVKILAKEHDIKDIKLLKKLKDIAITSQTLTA